MEKNARLAFRILASLYPDKKPSEVKKIITEALEKEECPEDMELWMILTKNAEEEQEEKPAEKKVIEEHHYYHHYGYDTTVPSITYCNSDKNSDPYWTITCNDDTSVVTNAISSIAEGLTLK